MKIDKVKPCPFCGGAEYFIENAECNSELKFVTCMSDNSGNPCQSSGPIGHSDMEAIDAWNKRIKKHN